MTRKKRSEKLAEAMAVKLAPAERLVAAICPPASASRLQQTSERKKVIMYLKFKYKDTEVVLTPETIRDIRRQLVPQVKQMPFGELIETFEATGLSAKNLLALFKKGKEEME